MPKGVTIIELLIVLALVGLLASLAAPGFRDLTAARQVLADQYAVHGLINAARQAAIRLNQPVTLCPAHPTGCGPRDRWHAGMIVFADRNRNRQLDDDEVHVASHGPLHGRVRWRSFRNRSYLRFMPSGLTDWQNGHFLFCLRASQPELARMLIVNRAGRVYASNDADGDGIHENARGEPLDC